MPGKAPAILVVSSGAALTAHRGGGNGEPIRSFWRGRMDRRWLHVMLPLRTRRLDQAGTGLAANWTTSLYPEPQRCLRAMILLLQKSLSIDSSALLL